MDYLNNKYRILQTLGITLFEKTNIKALISGKKYINNLSDYSFCYYGKFKPDSSTGTIL